VQVYCTRIVYLYQTVYLLIPLKIIIMKKLDLTTLGVEKLDKKQMVEIKGGITPEQARGMAEFWAPTPRIGKKATSMIADLMKQYII
jgi:hypothetical protein